MIIDINDKTTIGNIQRHFRAAYPFLKIRFADKSHGFGEITTPCLWYNSHVLIPLISKDFLPGIISIEPNDRVGDIEQKFRVGFALNPQIFRIEGSHWIQTAGTDILTVGEQNEIGRMSIERLKGLSGIEETHLL